MATKFEAREIKPGEFEVWDKLVNNYGSVFQTIKWTSIFEPNIKRVGIFDRGGQMIGGFIYFETTKMGLKIILNPPYTPTVGPFYKRRANKIFSFNIEQRNIVKTMVNYIEEQQPALVSISLDPSVIDTLPFYWNDYKVIVHYTYRISLKEFTIKDISSEQRRHIKKALEEGIYVEESFDIKTLYSLVEKTFYRQRKRFPAHFLKRILQEFPPGSNSYLIISKIKDIPLSAEYCVYSSKIAYMLVAGSDYDRVHIGAGALATYNAILKAKELGLEKCDTEGSMVPSIEEYLRSFGGGLTPYYRVNKAWMPIELVLKFFKRKLF